jgi:hypothetical protein
MLPRPIKAGLPNILIQAFVFAFNQADVAVIPQIP